MANHLTCERGLGLDHLGDALLASVGGDEGGDAYPLALADRVRAVGGLILDRWVPPAIDGDEMRGAGEVETAPPGLEREEENWGTAGALKRRTVAARRSRLTPPSRNGAGLAKRARRCATSRSPLPELGEGEGGVANFNCLLKQGAEAREFGAATFIGRDCRAHARNLGGCPSTWAG